MDIFFTVKIIFFHYVYRDKTSGKINEIRNHWVLLRGEQHVEGAHDFIIYSVFQKDCILPFCNKFTRESIKCNTII